MSKFSSKALRVALSAVLVVGLMPSTVWAKEAPMQEADQNPAKEQPVQAEQADDSSQAQQDQAVQEVAEPAAKTPEVKAEAKTEAKTAQPETIVAAETKVAAASITNLTLGVTSTVPVGVGSWAVLKFTASKAGTYEFYSTGSDDTYGCLYSNAESIDDSEYGDGLISTNDDGGENQNFKLSKTMYAGETVYVKVRFYSSSKSGNIKVCVDPYDSRTPLYSVSCDSTSDAEIFADGSVQYPTFSLYTYDDDGQTVYLVENVDYKIVGYYKQSGQEDNLVPFKDLGAGWRYAKLEGIGNYKGTLSLEFNLVDSCDLSSMYVDYDTAASILPNGSYRYPTFEVSYEDPSTGSWVYLTQDVDFYVAGYYSDGQLKNPVTSMIDARYAKLVGKGRYHGETGCDFPVRDLTQISSMNTSIRSGYVYPGGEIRYPEVRLYYYDEFDNEVYLTKGTDFEVEEQIYVRSYNEGRWSYRPVSNLSELDEDDAYMKVTGKGLYHGERYVSVWFNNYCSLSRANVSLDSSSGLLWSPREGDVIAYTGSAVTPSFTVRSSYGGTQLVEGKDYTVSSYSIDGQLVNASQLIGSATTVTTVTATITGMGDYYGSRDYEFRICPAIDVAEYESYINLRFGTSSIEKNGSFLYQGKAFVPALSLSNYSNSTPKLGTHYIVKYLNASGWENTPNAAGSYIARMIAVSGSGLTGTLDIPFKVVNSLSLIGMNNEWRDANLNARELYMEAVDAYTEDWVLYPDWRFDSVYNGIYYAKTYGLDYTTRVEEVGVYSDVYGTTGDAAIDASKVFKVIATGLGNFYDSVAKLFRVKSSAEKFNEMSYINVNDDYAGLNSSYADYVDLKLDSNGNIDFSNNTFSAEGFVYGVDYVVNRTVQEATVNGNESGYALTVEGMGKYGGLSRTAYVKLRDSGPSSKDLNHCGWGLNFADGVEMTSGHGYSVLKNAALGSDYSGIQVECHSYNGGETPVEGVDYTVVKTLKSSGELFIEIVPTPNSSWTGTAEVHSSIKLVDKLDVANTRIAFNNQSCYSENASVDITVPGTSGSVDLRIFPEGLGSMLAQGTDCTVNVVDAINGASASLSNLTVGTYRITIAGKGSKWTGSRTVTLNVKASRNISLQSCEFRPYTPDYCGPYMCSYTGKAVTPRFMLFYDGKQLTEGVDYAVSYGNNVNTGKAWMKATAIVDGNFVGSVSKNFEITKSVDISEGVIQYNVGNRYYMYSSYNTPVATLSNGFATLDFSVQLRNLGFNYMLPSDCYTVTYYNNATPGMAYAKIEGVPSKGYTGALFVNFVVQKGSDIYSLGDVNNNGRINIVDAQIVYGMAIGTYGTSYASMTKPAGWTTNTLKSAADVNRNGNVDATDARAIQYYALNGEFGS